MCALCKNHRLLFEPITLVCSGSCGMQKIRRNANYYTDRNKQNYWCERCHGGLTEADPVQLDDGKETTKSLLLKLKNDATPEESWVQCDECHDWVHQICALFNPRQNVKSPFTCPKCHLKAKTADEGNRMLDTSFKDAKDLPQCKMSEAMEERLSIALLKAYEKVAQDRGCTVAQVEKAEDLTIRVVSSLEKKHKVREEVSLLSQHLFLFMFSFTLLFFSDFILVTLDLKMLAKYLKKEYPSEFPVKSKCILLFQKIHGVDVLLFGMYVYEYGENCPAPNRRRVYISYLDSVRYIEPSSYRTLIYQTIIVEYLRYVKSRGFHTAHIWSCPPSKGDEYIFHCHPSQQLTPRDDMLCAWYIETLNIAKDEGVVLETRTLYDEYFKNDGIDPKTGEAFDPTSIPYFDGDYIPGEIENIIKELKKDDSNRKASHPKPASATQKKEGKRTGTRSNPGDLINQERDKVMMRLGLVLARMKQNFIVAQLLSDDFIHAVDKGEDVSSWTEEQPKPKGKNPSILECPHSINNSTVKDAKSTIEDSALALKTIGNTEDEDPLMEQECLDTRLHFLNYCQKNNFQFDKLRHAKYTTMMLLCHLHNPRTERDQQIKVHLEVIAHASSCSGSPGCVSSNCLRMKQLFDHVKGCDVTFKRGCKICVRLFMLLTKHARDCDSQKSCPIPFCDRIRERNRRLLKQQQLMDDRRRNAQNDRHRPENESECK